MLGTDCEKTATDSILFMYYYISVNFVYLLILPMHLAQYKDIKRYYSFIFMKNY